MLITVVPEKMAQTISYTISKKSIFISITCPNEDDVIFANNEYILDIFRMKFNDLDVDTDGLKAPVQENFNGLKNFIDKYKDEVEEIVLHCAAGASRSPGCGLAICEYLKNYNTEESRKKYEKYNYNRAVYNFTKNELKIGKDKNYYDKIWN